MATMPLQPGDRITLRLDSLAAGGEAVGRHEGLAVFAMWGCPGDEADVEVTEVSSRFARGLVRGVLTPSPDRIAAPCPHFASCGGCQIQHISYPAQLRHKTQMLRDALARIGGLAEVDTGDIWSMDDPWRYRNRATYHADVDGSGVLRLGFTLHHSHEVFALRDCALQHPLAERTPAAALDVLSRLAQGPTERAALLGLETLVSFSDGRAIATLVCQGRPPFVASLAEELMARVDGLAGVCLARARGRLSPHRSPSESIAGEEHLSERLGASAYRVSPDSFFQVNPTQASRLVKLVSDWASVAGRGGVLDLYTGVGTFLLPLARAAHHAVGVESDASAFADARANLRKWRLGNVTLYERKVERILPRFAERDWRVDVIVLDPPRKGCGPIVCAAVARLNPRRIILISCHPATLARDLKSLASLGYPVRRLQPLDMFPHTWHVEAAALCEPAA